MKANSQNFQDHRYVRLKGRNLKGKNRIHNQGNLWKILKKSQFNKDEAFYLQSVKDANHFRWVLINNDDDFIIEEYKYSLDSTYIS